MEYVIVVALIALPIIAVIMSENEKEVKKHAELKRKEYLKSIGIPKEATQYFYINGIPNFLEKNLIYIWNKDKTIYFLQESNPIKKYELSFDNINFYSIKGDLKQETEVTNELTQGQTMVAEGVLGTAAAIKRNQPTIKTVDERKTIINANIDGKEHFISFKKGDMYNYLLEKIPEKEQSFMNMKK